GSRTGAGDGRRGEGAGSLSLHPAGARRAGGGCVSACPGTRRAGRDTRLRMRILPLVSSRGWSSDAYWAARIRARIEPGGHDVTLVCRRGSERRVMERARDAGVGRIETLGFASGVKPATDAGDLRRLVGWLRTTDVVHVHRGKEHWLAAMANRLSRTPRPLVRTRHIVQPIRPHALNRWLYRRATTLVVTVTEAIRRQYIAADLVPPDRVVAMPGGVDLARYHPGLDGAAARQVPGVPR